MQIAPVRLNATLGLACSPRAGGNSDAAAGAFFQGFSAAGGRMDLLHLRDQRVLPCVSCGACERFAPAHAVRGNEGGAAVSAGQAARICPLTGQDDSAELFARLYTAQALFLALPIYFYHMPALLKGFVDRGQAFWMLKANRDATLNSLPPRPAWVVMVAGRPQGERLFEGALLTLKYFCGLFNFELQDPMLLPGFDTPQAIARTAPALEHITRYGGRAAATIRP